MRALPSVIMPVELRSGLIILLFSTCKRKHSKTASLKPPPNLGVSHANAISPTSAPILHNLEATHSAVPINLRARKTFCRIFFPFPLPRPTLHFLIMHDSGRMRTFIRLHAGDLLQLLSYLFNFSCSCQTSLGSFWLNR